MTRPPEAQLIYDARIALGLSFRQAAALADISEGSWRRTESAKRLVRTAATLARMAAVTGVTADQLLAAGRPDAAKMLTAIIADRSGPEPDNGGGHRSDMDALRDEVRSMRTEMERLAAALERRNRRDDTQAKRRAAG